MSRYRGKRKVIKARYLEAGLSVSELLDWIESTPETEEARNRTYWQANDAAHDLIAYGTSATLPILERLSRKPNGWMRWIGFRVLKEVRDSQGKDVLWQMCQTHKDVDVKLPTLEVLAILKDDRIYETAVALFNDENSALKRRAMVALGNLGDARAFDLIAPLLDTSDEDIRRSAVWAFGLLGDKRALAALTTCINTFPYKLDLISAFARIGGLESLDALEKILNQVSSHPNEGQVGHIRCYAVDAIAQIEAPAALAVLQAAGASHPLPGVRKRARRALQKRAKNTSADKPLV